MNGSYFFQPQAPVEPTGEEALAQGLGQLSQGAMAAAGSVGYVESKANLIVAMNSAQQAQRNANAQMLQNPGQAEDIATKMNSTISAITQNASLNSDDRYELERMSSWQTGSLNDQADRISIGQAKLQNELNFQTQFPTTLQNIAGLAITNPDLANQQTEALIQTAQGMVKSGNMTMDQYSKVTDMAGRLYSIAGEHISAGASGNQNAQQYHQYAHIAGQASNPNLPQNYTSSSISANLNADQTYDDSIAGVYQGKINPMPAINGSPAQFENWISTVQGVTSANAAKTAGVPLQQIQARFNYLHSQASESLTTSQQAEMHQLSNIIADSKNPGYFEQTTAGQQLIGDYNQKQAAIDGNNALSDTQKQQQTAGNINNFVTAYINGSKAQGLPSSSIAPIPPSVSAPVQGAFNINQDPQSAVNMIGLLNPRNRPFLANSMGKPEQQMSVYVCGNLIGTPQQSFCNEVITANQSGRDFSMLKNPEGVSGNLDNNIKASIVSNMAPTFSYLRSQPNGDQQASALINSITNVVKYNATQNPDAIQNGLSSSQINTYVNNAAKSVNAAFPVISGNGYSFNTKQVNITQSQAQNLSDYMIRHVNQNLPANMSLNNNYTTVSLPDGNIGVMDQNRNVVYSEPYTNSLLQAANMDKQKVNQQIQQISPPTPDLPFPT